MSFFRIVLPLTCIAASSAPLQGCVAYSVASTTADVVGTGISTTAKVIGGAASLAVDAVSPADDEKEKLEVLEHNPESGNRFSEKLCVKTKR